jgi:hypothetical protein
MYEGSIMGGESEDFEGSSIGDVGGSGWGDGNGEDSVGIDGVREVSDVDLESREVS